MMTQVEVTGTITLHMLEDQSLRLEAKLYRQPRPPVHSLLIIALATHADLAVILTAVKRLKAKVQVSLKIFWTDSFTLV